ncbi:MAG: indole-3-glycerol phosphate synthase TrpC [Verrucomicrobiae bacterium]|nr:indole-3-glycerol phosphate synthase TrpC [Verrucomicrobiae bacterium]
MTILDKIVEHKKREVATLPQAVVTGEVLRSAMAQRGSSRDFIAALRNASAGKVALIAEIKRASPSAGMIRSEIDPGQIAAQYYRAGAACISVLTESQFFKGSLADLKSVRNAVPLPILRKDFIVDERQILESIDYGADAILLIVGILGTDELRRLHGLATGAGLAVLVEVHDEFELERAIDCGATLIGINNRNLRTFEVDISTTERLASVLWSRQRAQNVVLVAESGIKTRADVDRVRRAGAGAILVGETLMRAESIGQKIAELLGTAENRPYGCPG